MTPPKIGTPEFGVLGGSSRSKAKAKAARANGAKPCAPGKRRGNFSGKPRTPKKNANPNK